MSDIPCRIATRRSPLAIWQAEFIAKELNRHHNLTPELVRLQTTGDRILDHPLAQIGGKGLFIKELEQALLQGRADLAVHSMKDVPAALPEGLVLGAICAREDPRDAVIAPHHGRLQDLPAGARVGTSSLRRQSQIQAQFPELQFIDLRGNVGTRIEQALEGAVEAVVLAHAGLIRLQLTEHVTEVLEPSRCLPAIGQGALGIEIADHHPQAGPWLSPLHDPATADAVAAERTVSRTLGGSCQTPLAALAVALKPGHVKLEACLASPDGRIVLRATSQGKPEASGLAAAQQLLDQGGDRILAQLGVEGFN